MRMIGSSGSLLTDEDIVEFLSQQLETLDLVGRSVCVVIPDGTRRCPVPLLLGGIARALSGRVRSIRAVTALGTHSPVREQALQRLSEATSVPVTNHEWWDPSTFAEVGTLSRATVRELSGGRLDEDVLVRVNRMVVESDVTILVGPVQPHEVVGFSGGNKYLFPGLSGPELIDLTHWLGALLTSREVIGVLGTTPVRALIDAAARLVPSECYGLSVVVSPDHDELEAMSFGEPRQAWASAAEVAAESHIVYLPQPCRRVLSLVPVRYPDLWTGAKGFYKAEPIVADGGEVVLYAPHIAEVASNHRGLLEIGYHCRDYFLSNWQEYRNYPRAELAHSTHLFGSGTYDAVAGEQQRVRVVLATGIPAKVARQVNLLHRSPTSVDVTDWESDPEALVIRDAGEVLYRLGTSS